MATCYFILFCKNAYLAKYWQAILIVWILWICCDCWQDRSAACQLNKSIVGCTVARSDLTSYRQGLSSVLSLPFGLNSLLSCIISDFALEIWI